MTFLHASPHNNERPSAESAKRAHGASSGSTMRVWMTERPAATSLSARRSCRLAVRAGAGGQQSHVASYRAATPVTAHGGSRLSRVVVSTPSIASTVV